MLPARAIRRAGELLKQVNGKGNNQHMDSAAAGITQNDIAKGAGMSKHQQTQAVSLANVPAGDFNRQLDRKNLRRLPFPGLAQHPL